MIKGGVALSDKDSIKSVRNKFVGKEEREILIQMQEKLKAAIALKEQGEDEAGDKMMADIKDWLEKQIDEKERAIKTVGKVGKSRFDKSVLPTPGSQFAETERTKIVALQNVDKEEYLATVYEYSPMKSLFVGEDFRETLWQEALEDDTFVCSIYERTGEYIGYCAIKDLNKNDWEIAIELKSRFCGKGYGTETISTFMKAIASVTGNRFFCAKVDIDNYASQAMMRKAGGYPDGLSEFVLHGEDIILFQNENRHLIDDKIREVAYEFSMDAEDILGYVLVYRFDMERL